MRVTRFWPGWAIAAGLTGLACEGRLEGAAGNAGPGPDAAPGGGIGPNGPSAIDEAMRAANPELHASVSEYFPGLVGAGGSKRLFRLTRTQLDLTSKALLPLHYSAMAQATLPRDPLQTNYEYAANLGFSAASFTPFTQWVEQMAKSAKAQPRSVLDCSASGDSPACLAAEATRFVNRAFRGVVTDAQLARYAEFFVASVGQVGLAAATADLVDVTLGSPHYVFRDEVETEDTGRLGAARLLQNLSYTLADAPPEAVGLEVPGRAPAAMTQAELAEATESVLARPEAREKLLRFFIAWLEVREPDEIDLDPGVFPEFTAEVAAAAVEETKAFLRHQLTLAAPKLRDVTESTQSFVSDALAFIYGVDKPGTTTLLDLNPEQRLGIFTQPALLASHSGPTTTRLVKRGVFFTRKVMCLPLGVPPADVDTSVPATSGVTERQRIESVTTPPKCAGCHAFINPFGFMQENYDAMGRFRSSDAGLPVDASISVDFLDEGKLTTDSPVVALRGFSRSLRFQQCFTRQLFRFYTGRDEEPTDDPVLRQMLFNFASDEAHDLLGMLRTLANSPSFSQRTESP